MDNLDSLINQYYEKYQGLPNGGPIVRMNQPNDAFEIVVLETLYGDEMGIDISEISERNVEKLTKYIVPAPDDGIDIVVEHDDIDGSSYDFVQVKNAELSPLGMQQALSGMKRTISNFLKDQSKINKHLKTVLSNTNISSSDTTNFRYILVHRGKNNYFKNQDKDELIITGTELKLIRDGKNSKKNSEIPLVPSETFSADSFNNFITYEESDGNPAILLNLRGLELAQLALKYTNTSLGRNILFGHNLRESLSNKSKTYEGMAKTIKNEPANFWFYNNGITIIAENYNIDKDKDGNVEKLILNNFSIINGAQTTSALGEFLKQSDMNGLDNEKKQLENVYVLARILKVTDNNFKSQIAIYNNTQNPITTRDMASNRVEQTKLNEELLKGIAPNIYMEIRRGMKAPNNIKLYKHQHTSNIELAQLAYASFLLDPYSSKDKKNTIFDTDYKQQDYLLNKYYDKLFHYDAAKGSHGELFKRGKKEIDELLFVYYLFKLSKKNYIRLIKDRINVIKKQLNNPTDDDDIKNQRQNMINNLERMKAIANICTFFCITYYYYFKVYFPDIDKGLFYIYKYKDFYSNKEDFQTKLIGGFRDLFLAGTIELIVNLTEGLPNLNTWVRNKNSADNFKDKVKNELESNMMPLQSRYEEYVEAFKQSEINS